MRKFIFITGGVCSSLGKGIAASSIANILKNSGKKISIQKLDPYLNVDPGTMSPFQHGEVFVTNDGAETDLDLGHYERFLNENLNKFSSVTTGKIYQYILNKERNGDYLGGTIQVVPHIVDEIKKRIFLAYDESNVDILIVEIGGTVGDIEGEPFLEAIRQIRQEIGNENALSIHLTLLPFLKASKELKTKPTQISVQQILRLGVQPDMIIARADYDIPEEILTKISKFCNIKKDCVFPAPTVSSIYEVPVNFDKKNMAQIIAREMDFKPVKPNLSEWSKMLSGMLSAKEGVKIALVVKYYGLEDAYLSVIESLKIACGFHNKKLSIIWVDSEKLENDNSEFKKIKQVDGVIIPGGFGKRGILGKIQVASICRKEKIPYFGICLGSQIMAIEFARNELGIKDANSEEFDTETKNKIVHFLPGQNENLKKGGTMRLGSFDCKIKIDTLAYKIYQKDFIQERHRHRYEFNLSYKKDFEKKNFVFSGVSPDEKLVEIVEVKDHPFMIGVQFHPEFLSRPLSPHPIFRDFIGAIVRS